MWPPCSSAACTLDYLKKAVTATAAKADYALTEQATATQGYARSFSTIMVPQSGFQQIDIMIEGKANPFVFVYQEEVTPTMSHFPFMGERVYAHSNTLIISIPSEFCM